MYSGFNNGFGGVMNGAFYQQPMGYRQQMAPQMPPQVPAVQEDTLYVPNEQAAEAYLMAPNSYVRLWDANQPVFYVKKTDAQGRPYPMEKYTYQKATEQPVEESKDLAVQFVTREEFEALRAKLEPRKDKGERKND